MRQYEQVLVVPFRRSHELQYLVMKRCDMDAWQFVAGGLEHGETSETAARRELMEETGCDAQNPLFSLKAFCLMPVSAVFRKFPAEAPLLVRERAWAVDVGDVDVSLSHEHSECDWLPYSEAAKRLRFDSNRTALWETDLRVGGVTQQGINEAFIARHGWV